MLQPAPVRMYIHVHIHSYGLNSLWSGLMTSELKGLMKEILLGRKLISMQQIHYNVCMHDVVMTCTVMYCRTVVVATIVD